jgi:ankyrin repeat protein
MSPSNPTERHEENVARFFEACAAGDVEALRDVLRHDPSLVRIGNPRAPHQGWTGLHSAARAGHVQAVRLLLEHGADPNARETGDNTTALHWAAAHAQLDTVRALLDAGADVHGFGDVHELDVIGWAAFYHAPDAEARVPDPVRLAVVSLLLERGARHHIFSALSVGEVDLIRSVVQQDPAALDRRLSRFEKGLTALHFAISRERHDHLDLLIELGANLEAEDMHRQTAMAFAMLRGDRDAIRRLDAAGARPPASDAPASVQAGMAALADSVKKCVPMLVVPDVARALEWYVSLGFKELARHEDDGLVNFGMVALGSAELMLNLYGKIGDHDSSIWFYTDKIDEVYQLLKSRQLATARAELAGEPGTHQTIVFEQDIEDMFYGARQFCIRDLNGYQLYFIR